MIATASARIADSSLPGLDANLLRSVGEAVTDLARFYGLSDAELAASLGVTPRTLDRWRRAEAVPQREARRRLAVLVALANHVRDTFEDDAIATWLRSENRYLGSLTPLEAIRAGRPDRVEAALEAIDSGIFH